MTKMPALVVVLAGVLATPEGGQERFGRRRGARWLACMLVAGSLACDDSSGEGIFIPSEPTRVVSERACDIESIQSWTDSAPSASRNRYIPLFDMKLTCVGGNATTNLWMTVKLTQEGAGLIEYSTFSRKFEPGETRWICAEDEPYVRGLYDWDGCPFNNQPNLLKSGGGFRWEARWNYCLYYESCGYPSEFD